MDALHDLVGLWLQPAFSLWGSPITWTELLACALSLWMVGCNMRVHPLGWPLAIVSSLLYAALFLHYRLYGEASLQLVFVALAGWGWWEWLHGRGGDGQRLTVHRLGGRARLRVAVMCLVAWPLLGLLLHRMTDSDVPFLDALPTVGSVAGQILLGRKLIENWPVWIAVNLVSVGLFAYKGLWLTVLLYVLFALLAVWGWRRWQALEGQVHG